MDEIIEISDQHLDQEAIRRQVAAQVAERRAANAYDPELTSRGPASLRSGLAAIGSRAENELGSNEVLVSLAMYHRLLEPEFTSTAPIIGPVIVKVRRIWNWMSTKWYLRPILRQQNNINAQLVLMLTELAHRQEVTEQRIIEMESMLKGLDSPTYQEECQE